MLYNKPDLMEAVHLLARHEDDFQQFLGELARPARISYPRRRKRKVAIAADLSPNLRAPDWYDTYKDESAYEIYVKKRVAEANYRSTTSRCRRVTRPTFQGQRDVKPNTSCPAWSNNALPVEVHIARTGPRSAGLDPRSAARWQVGRHLDLGTDQELRMSV